MPIGTTAAIIAASLAAGGSVAGGLANKSKTSTSTSTSTPTLSPELGGLQDDLIGRITSRLNTPKAGNIDGLRTQGIDQVNKTFNATPQRLTEQFSSRGFGSSGSLNRAIGDSEIARAGAITDVDQSIDNMVNSNEQNTMALAANVLSAGRGSSVTSSGTTPGNGAAGALEGGVNGVLSGVLLKSLLAGK